MRKYLLIVLSALVCSGVAHAGGSVAFDDVATVLKQRPELSKYLLSTLEFEETADANIRFGPQFQYLSGGRMGPYTVSAKPKGQQGRYTLEITVCTDATMLDAKGKPAKDVFKAVSLKEKLLSVIIRDASDTSKEITCPDLSK